MIPELNNKKVLVIGLGKSGIAAAKLLLKNGAQVFLTEEKKSALIASSIKKLPKKIKVEVGSHKFFSKDFDLIVVSPGVPWDHPFLVRSRDKGIPVWPELELGWRFVKAKKTIAITGTNGKTTTTALIAHLIKSAGKPVVVGGNIGTPLCDLVPEINSKTYLVLEVSSYQLEAQQTFAPDVSVVLNLTPDHLARHKTMNNYMRAKRRIFINMTEAGTAVYNKKDSWCVKMVKGIKAKKVSFPSSSLKKIASNIQLPGQHNLENAMASVAATLAVDIDKKSIEKGLKIFKGVPHRIEFVRELNGVQYFNDSKATNVDSTLVALKSFKSPVILILGGEHKGSSYKPLLPLIRKKVKEILTIGEAAPIIEQELKTGSSMTWVENLKNAVAKAQQLAKRGDVVLLSPACASFDQFNNFEHRGQHFIELVKMLH